MERTWYVLQDLNGLVEILPFEKHQLVVGSMLASPENRLEHQDLEGDWEVVAFIDSADQPHVEAVNTQDGLYGEPRGMRFLCSLMETGIQGGFQKALRQAEEAQ